MLELGICKLLDFGLRVLHGHGYQASYPNNALKCFMLSSMLTENRCNMVELSA